MQVTYLKSDINYRNSTLMEAHFEKKNISEKKMQLKYLNVDIKVLQTSNRLRYEIC